MYHISPSQLVSDSRYTFAVGLVRALEVRLFNQQTVNRLLDSKDIHVLKRELAETEYHHILAVCPDLCGFEAELHQGLKRVYELITAMAPEPDLINLLRIRYDFHNIKAGYKAKYFGEPVEEAALSDLGLVDKKLLLEVIETDSFDRLPSWLSGPVASVIACLGQNSSGVAVDMAFDKAMYSFLYREAKARNLFLEMLFQQYIDLTNIKSWLRIKKRESDKKLLSEALLDHGFIEKRRFLDLYELNIADLPARLAYTPYARVISEGISRYQQQGTFTQLQRLIENYMLEYIKSARLSSMGPEPLIAYIWAKENEVKVLRTILVGKLNELSLADIKERLPMVYA